MSHLTVRPNTETEIADPRWKELYLTGAVFSILIAISVILAIVAFLSGLSRLASPPHRTSLRSFTVIAWED